ncbi:hypothetical protein C8J56DRAFT_1054679 [Mycena floridula]|nr:hypothetical protein C8J56DRAFT_1054679 [Mycena floridula]
MSSNTELELFHTGPVVHTHQKCNNCLVFRRCSTTAATGKLSQCAACKGVRYCSKECQKADWSKHKSYCTARVAERRDLATKTGIPSCMDDFYAWMEFYDAPLKNCAVAAFELRDNRDAHLDRDSMLSIVIEHKNDMNLPTYSALIRCYSHHSDATSTTASDLCSGNIYFDFSGQSPALLSPVIKYLSFDKSVPAVRMIPNDCEVLFRAYVNRGEMMKFCCGKMDIDGICCCGGWIHDEENQESFCKFGYQPSYLSSNSQTW